MSIDKKLSLGCLNFVKNNTSSSEEDLEKIYYGIQVIWINLFKFIILFVTAYLLGVLRYTFTAFIVFAILRSFASGVHANSSIQCIIGNYILFLGNVFLSVSLTLNLGIKIIIFVISFILLVLYAPADTEERPLISKKLRKKLKIKSIIVSLILFISSFALSNEYANLIIFSILEESIVITPIAYKILNKKYDNYKNISI